MIKIFFKNPLGTFPAPIQVLPNCKVSEKLDERAQRYFRAYGRDSLGLQRLRRETKNPEKKVTLYKIKRNIIVTLIRSSEKKY